MSIKTNIGKKCENAELNYCLLPKIKITFDHATHANTMLVIMFYHDEYILSYFRIEKYF